jgi:PAS domain-containing protein
MTPQRLEFLLRHFHHRCTSELTPAKHRAAVAHFLNYEPRMVRRWLNGQTDIPHTVEIIAELMFCYPMLTVGAIEHCLKGEPVNDFSTALRHAKVRLQAALELANLARHRLDLRTRILEHDPRLHAALAFPASKVITPELWHSRIHRADLQAVADSLARAMDGENGGIYDKQYRLRKGPVLHSRGQVLFDGKEPIECIGVTQISGAIWKNR